MVCLSQGGGLPFPRRRWEKSGDEGRRRATATVRLPIPSRNQIPPLWRFARPDPECQDRIRRHQAPVTLLAWTCALLQVKSGTTRPFHGRSRVRRDRPVSGMRGLEVCFSVRGSARSLRPSTVRDQAGHGTGSQGGSIFPRSHSYPRRHIALHANGTTHEADRKRGRSCDTARPCCRGNPVQGPSLPPIVICHSASISPRSRRA